ncbi:hypothetical protein AAU57_00385 [Nonlabens sp. YIK11]|uniref:DUF3857 domain-containing protein n=1 Tax=Nonlabens sp. YIK11 TaxID=1453349 RepID=UPI0006DC8283|nr:DUF3857 domain-containing protein [Nonlabens sp. YIK11]KQC31948.1 hypothetical protein AAU57_00385 [Nonlabens sp. YIK11]
MRLFLLIGVLFTTLTAFAQDYRFGRVEESDFETTTIAGEELPSAEVLFRKEHVTFRYVQGTGFIQYRDVHERIKINTDEGLEYATKNVRLYDESSSKRERLKNLKGYTYSLNDGKVEDVKLRSSGEFEEEINEYWKKSSFTMPDVRVGSIIEYEYSIVSPFMAIDDLDLQYDIPIKKLDVRIEMLEYYTYNVLFNPRASYVPSLERSVAADKIKINSKTRSGGDMGSPVSTKFSSQQYELSNQVLVLDTENIPALKDEPMAGDLSLYRSKIIFELAAIKYPTEPIELLSTNWESVAKSIYELDTFGDQLKTKPFYEDELEFALQGSTSVDDKIQKVYDFVKRKVKWNGYYGFTSRNGIKDAYKEGSGNVGDINLLLTSMLQNANIDAHPVLLSTKDNGIPLFPTRNGFNYVATVINMGDKTLMLDATEEVLPVGSLPLRAMNWQGRVLLPNGESYWLDISPKNHSSEMSQIKVAIDEDMVIKGTSKKRLTKQLAYSYRKDHSRSDEETVTKYLKDDVPRLEISDLELKNVDVINKPVEFSYQIAMDGAAEKIGDKIYISPLLNESNIENPFKMEDRKLPIVLGYPLSTKTFVTFEIPDGYEVASLPESIKYEYNNGRGSYQFLTSSRSNVVTVSANFEMNDLEVLPGDYPQWKDFFTAIVAKDAEKIVLKKI